MAKLRSRREVVERCTALTTLVREALAQLPEGERDPAVIDAAWQAGGPGTPLWALRARARAAVDPPLVHGPPRAQLALRVRLLLGRGADGYIERGPVPGTAF